MQYKSLRAGGEWLSWWCSSPTTDQINWGELPHDLERGVGSGRLYVTLMYIDLPLVLSFLCSNLHRHAWQLLLSSSLLNCCACRAHVSRASPQQLQLIRMIHPNMLWQLPSQSRAYCNLHYLTIRRDSQTKLTQTATSRWQVHGPIGRKEGYKTQSGANREERRGKRAPIHITAKGNAGQ